MNAYLLLANGMVFAGQSVGAEGVTVGEVVFATGMVGKLPLVHLGSRKMKQEAKQTL